MKLFKKKQPIEEAQTAIPPGRISQPDDPASSIVSRLIHKKGLLVQPEVKSELIQVIRDLYKVNPDMGIALQNMFKLTNTGHRITFRGASDKEESELIDHFLDASKTWSDYTAGIDGLVNKMIVQMLVTGCISIEAVPKRDLSGIETIVFLRPETVRFRRISNGRYQPYQVVPNTGLLEPIKLNLETFFYVSQYNDTDDPYGVPPFLPSLEPLDGQATLKWNYKNLMEQAGMLGFLEVKMQKSPKRASESDQAYISRITQELRDLKTNVSQGMMDGLVVGHMEDHEFEFHATTEKMGNALGFWDMNQQSVANGLGVSGNIIGIQNANTEGGAGILLSTMISQLRNIQIMVAWILQKIYDLELRLNGKPKIKSEVAFAPSTIADELKVQQGIEIKVRNLVTLYNQGIISQNEFARLMGYEKADQKEPRVPVGDPNQAAADKAKREADKDSSDRGSRDKGKINPSRGDQNPKKRNS